MTKSILLLIVVCGIILTGCSKKEDVNVMGTTLGVWNGWDTNRGSDALSQMFQDLVMVHSGVVKIKDMRTQFPNF